MVTPTTEVRQTVVTAPAGHCIFCGDVTGKLSDEHVLPLALGGRLVIPKASCAACAKIQNS